MPGYQEAAYQGYTIYGDRSDVQYICTSISYDCLGIELAHQKFLTLPLGAAKHKRIDKSLRNGGFFVRIFIC